MKPGMVLRMHSTRHQHARHRVSSLHQHDVQVSVSVHIAHTDICRGRGGILECDLAIEAPRAWLRSTRPHLAILRMAVRAGRRAPLVSASRTAQGKQAIASESADTSFIFGNNTHQLLKAILH